MELPEDMRKFNGQEWNDSFQLLTPENAGIALLILVALVCIFEPLL